MNSLHPQARTTPLVRAEIAASSESLKALAKRYHLSVATVRKWRGRETFEDRSHCPHTLSTTLTPAQELIVVELRKTLLLSLDDLLVVTREFINPQVSRSGLDRCLRRHGVSNLQALQPQEEGDSAPKKTFKDYEPGFLHIDIKYLPKMPDEEERRYLFVAIDRATRWVYLRVYDDQTEISSTDFLRRVHDAAPMKIQKLLTDNGSHKRIVSPARKKNPVVIMPLIKSVPNSRLNTACRHPVIRKPMVWWNALMAALANSSNKHDSLLRRSWKQR